MQVDKKNFRLIKEVLDKRGWIELPAQGTSMYPLITQGNICRFIIVDPTSMNKGDIILFQTSDGKLVTHRFVRVVKKKDQIQYIFKGDTNMAPDEPVSSEKIVGKLALISKRKTYIKTAGLYNRWWTRIIFSFPEISGILRSYLNRKESRAA